MTHINLRRIRLPPSAAAVIFLFVPSGPSRLSPTVAYQSSTPFVDIALAAPHDHPFQVDLVAEWASTCGLQDIWATEAAILSVSLESYEGSALGDTSLQYTSTSSSVSFAAPVATMAAVVVAAAAASK